jgi:hypothetical protein
MLFKNGREEILSLDQATIHTRADLEEVGLTEANTLWNPAKGGDLHMVIEHVHAQLEHWFQERLRSIPAKLTEAQYKKEFEKLFKERVTALSIEKDCRALNKLYKKVLANGGNYAPKKDR